MSELTEKQVIDYLAANPDWLVQQEDLQVSVRAKVKDFREAQLVKAKVENDILSQRQQQWLAALRMNEKLSYLLWDSAAHLARANGYQAIESVLDVLLFESLDFPAHALKLFAPCNKRPVPRHLQMDMVVHLNEVRAYSRLPNSMSNWFEHNHASFLVLPIVYQGHTLGMWVVASDQQDYFNTQLDTTYLEAYVQVLGAALARIMGVTVLC
ncbi:DUF484 family protein [Vitreoscilla stercoraria]|uniref:DUF484 family protein n=1 Tax=Vitreoscilla stercoraria TaxID=61 RepID=A0ABY4E7L3_VITST|nr:DUF484 family protein [Vitreoscilla stercoraria]UOO91756.1 DUF484 family protein [Vitreoscilla stercoraria]